MLEWSNEKEKSRCIWLIWESDKPQYHLDWYKGLVASGTAPTTGFCTASAAQELSGKDSSSTGNDRACRFHLPTLARGSFWKLVQHVF